MTPNQITEEFVSDPAWQHASKLLKLARAYISLTEPVKVTCTKCSGLGYLPDDAEEDAALQCPQCGGSGSIPDPRLEEARKAFAQSPHSADCRLIFGRPATGDCAFPEPICNCWKSTFPLDGLLSRLQASERQLRLLNSEADREEALKVVMDLAVDAQGRRIFELTSALADEKKAVQNYEDYINTIRLNIPDEFTKQPQLDLCMQRMKEAIFELRAALAEAQGDKERLEAVVENDWIVCDTYRQWPDDERWIVLRAGEDEDEGHLATVQVAAGKTMRAAIDAARSASPREDHADIKST